MPHPVLPLHIVLQCAVLLLCVSWHMACSHLTWRGTLCTATQFGTGRCGAACGVQPLDLAQRGVAWCMVCSHLMWHGVVQYMVCGHMTWCGMVWCGV